MISISNSRLATLLIALLGFVSTAFAQYDPPGSYYNPAIGLTGAPLKAALNSIIDGHNSISYSNREGPLEVLDQDPANSLNVLVVYSGVSVAKTQFPQLSANTEHLWPNSYGIDDGNPAYGDLNNLRPCDANVNTARANKFFDDGGTLPAHPEAPLCRTDADSWEARDVEKGDLARAMFYMDTRYEGDGTDGFPRNLELTDNLASITTTNNNMGRLSTLISWHFRDQVSTEERIRNHTIYTTYQNNRNPFTDHPEYVWAIWGPTPNDSRLYVGAMEPVDGVSNAIVDLGDVFPNAAVPGAQNVTLNKAGSNPTTYEITLTGAASSSDAGLRQSFIEGVQSRVLSVGLTTSTASVGVKSGSMIVNNTDLTSSGAGRGLNDGDDTVDVTLRVLDHANASFESPADANTLMIDFGNVALGSGMQGIAFNIHNLEATPGLTGKLDLDAVNGVGDTAVLTTDIAPFANLPAGSSQSFMAFVDPASLGGYSATYTIELSDENIPGAAATPDLVLTLMANVVPDCPGADANCDEMVTTDDVAPFVDLLLGLGVPCSPCAGDVDASSTVDGADVAAFLTELLAP